MAIIGERPSLDSIRELRPFQGPVEGIVPDTLLACGIPATRILLTYLIAADVGTLNPRTARYREIASTWVPHLLQQIQNVSYVILIGSTTREVLEELQEEMDTLILPAMIATYVMPPIPARGEEARREWAEALANILRRHS
jgi:uracil-DNA glycosylase